MKKILSFVSTAALCLAFAACQVAQPEDVFSVEPVAPELESHGDILLTTGTTGEDLVFVWSAYRNLPEGLNYEFFMKHGDSPVSLSNGHDTYYKTGKAFFRDLVLSSFNDLPENDTFPLSFYVRVVNDGKAYESKALTVNVYAYGDGVAPEVSVTSEAIELDPADPQSEVSLLSWNPARLVYGEEVTYNVYIVVGDGEPVLLKEGLTETSYSTTVDELNEAVIAAGGAEDAEVPVKFIVEAVCESMPNGVEAAAAEMTVKTYVTTFPDVLYIPGSHQGWDPKTAPTITLSTAVKGYYEGIVDLTTDDNSDVEFKFCIVPDWGGDFGGEVTVSTKKADGGDVIYTSATGTVGASANIKVPSGKYVIMLSKKFSTLKMVSIASVGIIGEAVGGWGEEIPMTWDKETNIFTGEVNFTPGEYKFRLNNDWDYSVDDTYGVNGGGGNLKTSNEGNYRVILNMSKHPYTVRFINLSFPETVYLPGSHNGWGWSSILSGNGEGVYQGFLSVGGEWGFKVTPSGDWDHEQWGLDGAGSEVNGEYVYNIVNKGGNIREGLDETYARVTVDLANMVVKVVPVNSVEVVGSFTGWGTDEKYLMSFDAATNSWKLSNAEIPAGALWKFRMNSDWAVNLGYGTLDDLVQDGGNITDTEAGIYTIELFLDTTPYHATLTKTGDSDKPKWGNRLVVAGNYSGHSWSATDDPKLRGDYSGKFHGPLTMAGTSIEFKFVHEGAWFGSTGGDVLNWTLGDGGNLTIPAGTYWFDVDLEAGTATAFAITKVGLIGGFNGWSDDVVMDFDETALTYSGTFTAPADQLEFKVRFNGNWAYSLGDDPADLNCISAGNVKLAEGGTYKVVLDMAHNSPSLTVTKQ